jgi:hypothetical protein
MPPVSGCFGMADQALPPRVTSGAAAGAQLPAQAADLQPTHSGANDARASIKDQAQPGMAAPSAATDRPVQPKPFWTKASKGGEGMMKAMMSKRAKSKSGRAASVGSVDGIDPAADGAAGQKAPKLFAKMFAKSKKQAGGSGLEETIGLRATQSFSGALRSLYRCAAQTGFLDHARQTRLLLSLCCAVCLRQKAGVGADMVCSVGMLLCCVCFLLGAI